MARRTGPSRGAPSREEPRSPRLAQIASLMREVLTERLQRGLGDPRIRGLVSIVGIDVAQDLTEAIVRVSVLPEQYEPTVLRGLQAAGGRLHREIIRETRLRRVPKLVFRIDRSIKRQGRIEGLIREGGVTDAESGPATDAAADPATDAPGVAPDDRRGFEPPPDPPRSDAPVPSPSDDPA